MSLRDGRFGAAMDQAMRDYSTSIAIDLRMLDEDIDGSIAHARMLGSTGIIPSSEADTLVATLDRVRTEIADGTWRPRDDHEDIHMAVEARLVELVGDLGKKLHTARSRNDQVATDVRLWLKRRLEQIDDAVAELIATLVERAAGDDGRTLMPGYTHLQRGQPILLGHHLLAHAWALVRDRERLDGARARVDRSPLGACAMAGTPHPIDRQQTADLLGFATVIDNAMDAVSARDHIHEVAAACAIAMTRLSRMAEELVLWSSSEFAFVRVADAFATGSSIMPNKRNPDAAELVRGKAARVQADLTALLALTRSLPLAYNRDLQEDREPLFHAVETTRDSVLIMAGMWSTLEVRRDRFTSELAGDFSLATDLADDLTARGVPFRDAYRCAAEAVRWCEQNGVDLTGLPDNVATKIHPELGKVRPDPQTSIERRNSRGGTAWSEVTRQVEALRAYLAS